MNSDYASTAEQPFPGGGARIESSVVDVRVRQAADQPRGPGRPKCCACGKDAKFATDPPRGQQGFSFEAEEQGK